MASVKNVARLEVTDAEPKNSMAVIKYLISLVLKHSTDYTKTMAEIKKSKLSKNDTEWLMAEVDDMISDS